MVKIEIDVPDTANRFLKALNEFAGTNIEAYIVSGLISKLRHDIEEMVACPLFNPAGIKAKYGIEVDEKKGEDWVEA